MAGPFPVAKSCREGVGFVASKPHWRSGGLSQVTKGREEKTKMGSRECFYPWSAFLCNFAGVVYPGGRGSRVFPGQYYLCIARNL